MAVVLAPDPVDAPEASVEDRLRAVCGHLNVLHAELVALAAEALETGCWEGFGIRSLAHWLTWKAGLSRTHAAEIERLARAKASHPKVMATFGEGLLSLDQVTVATKAPAYLDADFAQLAQVCTVTQLRLAVRAARPAPPPPASADDNDSDSDVGVGGERVEGWFDDDGRYQLRGVLDPDHGRLVDAALSEARDALFHAGQTTVSWADALVEVAQRSLDATPVERRERFRAYWFIDPTDPIPARWIDGLPVPTWLQHLLTCDGTVAPVYTHNALPVSVGRNIHHVPDRTRRLVLYRDRTCRIPWCGQRRWLQVHHIHHRATGGGHDTNTLIALCPTCHRAHHQGHFDITGDANDPDGLTYTDPHGHRIDPRTRPIQPTAPPPTPTKPYDHPIGERLHKRELLFADPPVP
jgi:hypothetical protein